MIPDDDATWLHCQNGCDPSLKWCSHVRQYYIEGLDGSDIELGMRYCVPIVPALDVWGEVAIDSEALAPGMAYMYLVKSVPFTQAEDLIQLGLWSRGEGRASIAGVIEDWIKSQDGSECKNSSHGFKEETRIKSLSHGEAFNKANSWSILINSMCLPCFEKWNKVTSNIGSNFGLGGVITNHQTVSQQLGNFNANRA